jgi:hypothetical protein
MEHAQDEKSMLEANSELQIQMTRAIKLREYAEDIHETFRTIPLKSARLIQAEECFYEGKFQEMDGILDASKIREEIELLEEDCFFSKDEDLKEKARISMEYKSYELLVKGLYRYTFVDNPEWYEDVFELLEDARDASFNVHTLYELASYLKTTDEQEWAFELLDDAYVISRDTEGEACRIYEAKCLWAMGTISKNRDKLPEAIEYAGKSLKIYTKLSENNPEEYHPRMSQMLIIMGNYHTYSKNFKVALLIYEEAEKILRELASNDNFEYAMRLGDLLDKLASVHVFMGEFEEAFPLYEEALKIKDDNIEYNLYAVLRSKADTLYNLAVAHYSAHEYKEAISWAKEELKARKQVQEVDLLGQLPYRARTRNILSELYLNLNRPADAIREREKVVKLYRTLAEHFPDNYLHDLGEALNYCSNIYMRMSSYDKYFQAMTEALEIFRKLAAANPEEYMLTVGYLLANVCHYYERISPDREKALEFAHETYKVLSSIERDEGAEKAYTEVMRIIKNS